MGVIYENIIKQFSRERLEIDFDPKLLDELSYEERKSVEDKLIFLCQEGCNEGYKYIPYFKIVIPEELLSKEIIQNLPAFEQCSINSKLYERTGDNQYYIAMLQLARNDIESFGLLLYMSRMVDPNRQKVILNDLKTLVSQTTEENKKYYTLLISRHLNGGNENNISSGPKL